MTATTTPFKVVTMMTGKFPKRDIRSDRSDTDSSNRYECDKNAAVFNREKFKGDCQHLKGHLVTNQCTQSMKAKLESQDAFHKTNNTCYAVKLKIEMER